jgi:hypothetical protein
MKRSWLTYIALALMIAAPLRAQTIGQNKSAGASEVFTLAVRSQLVVEAVTVKDKNGKSVQGLTAGDFTLTENGVEQKIRFCEHQTLPATAEPLPATPAKDESITIYKRLGRTQLAPEQPESLRYKDRSGRRGEVRPNPDDLGRPGLHLALPGRIGGCIAGLYGRP